MMKDKIEKSEMIGIFNDPQPIPRKVPDYMRKKGGAWYWTGAMIMVTFMYEALTGLVILFYYQPAAAYDSTMNFVNSVPFGSLILTTHLYGAYAMIIFIYIHLLRNLFVGAYKKPRKNQWFTGVLLLLLTLGVGFFGYSMSGDVLSADATDVGRGIAAAVPYIGDYLKRMFFGNGTPLSLFHWMLGWHIVIAAGIGLLFALHFFMSERNTIMPKRSESNYTAPLVDQEKPDYKPWFPYNLLYMGEISLLVFAVILIIPSLLAVIPNVPALLDPFPQVAPSSPLASMVPSYPPWFLLFVYKAMDFDMIVDIGPFWGTVIFAGLPLIYLFLVPYLDTSKSLKIVDRPITLSFGIMGVIYMIGLSIWGALTPGVSIPDWQVLLFFFGIGIIVLGLVHLLVKFIKEDKIRIYQPEKLFVILALLGFSAFGTGTLIVSSIVGGYNLYQVPEILLAMITALLAVAALWQIYFASPDRKPSSAPLSAKVYISIAALLTAAAIAILFIISGLNPTSPSNNAGYGFGLGLIFLVGGVLMKIYRAAEYGE